MPIETVGQLKKLLSHYRDEVKIGIEDADEGSILQVMYLSVRIDYSLLLISGDYNHKITKESNFKCLVCDWPNIDPELEKVCVENCGKPERIHAN